MSVISDLTAGAAGGVFTGIGQLAKDIRSAITGKTELSSTDQINLATLAQALELKGLEAEKEVNLAQAAINLADAQSNSFFRGGWRPAAGWTCVFGLAYQFVLSPFLCWASTNFGWVSPPTLNVDTLLALLGGLLGLGVARSVERIKGANK